MSANHIDDIERRRFLQLMAASAALATGACSGPPPEAIVPYVVTPPELAHGGRLFYATAYVRGGYAHGVLVETNFGRPTKVEGNPDHPASLGSTDVYAQASVLELWDPERSRAVYRAGGIATWADYDAAWLTLALRLGATGGEGFRILTGPLTSPTQLAQLERVLGRYPQARWHSYSPVAAGHGREGARLNFGRALDTVLAPGKARVIVTLDADFLGDGPAAVRCAREIGALRERGSAATRLYALESAPSLTGANADERLALAPMEIERVAWRVAARLGAAPQGVYPANSATARWEDALAKALRANPGAALVTAGEGISVETHALVQRLNARLNNVGKTLHYVEPVAAEGAPLSVLAQEMHAGRVEALLVIGANPAYDAPAELDFAEALSRVPFSAHAGIYRDETGRAARWHLPLPHVYEQWSDARAYDGTLSIVQPVLRPLYDARSATELLARIAGDTPVDAYRLVRAAHSGAGRNDTVFEARWREALRAGIVADTARAPVAAEPRGEIAPPKLAEASLVAVFQPSPRIYDGSYANNAWLQELPHPLTQIVWDNALMLGPATAQARGLVDGEVVRAHAGSRTVECPVSVVPGHAEGVATLPLGYGRRAAGSVGDGIGFDAYRLVPADPAARVVLSLEKTGRRRQLVTAQLPASQQGRDLARSATLAELARNPRFANDEKIEQVPEESLYPPFDYPVHAWGMAIDLNACIGCGACTIACQAENNIPVVGRREVERGREMHWIRVDHYRDGAPEAPRDAFMPVPCMHCENAPCEAVCPVGATLHDSEGLNLQVYNRCIGTRFCNQNCPYKVRRFNFLKYTDRDPERYAAARNPEVTVRSRGVMEKCTYCVQRISSARIEAEKQGRRIRDGEVVTACQAACPTRAIHFGDLNDPQSAVSKVKASPLNYTLLAELNTRPRTTYLAKVRNNDPELE